MMPSSYSIAGKLRRLQSRHLTRDAYIRELISLADIDDQVAVSAEADRVMAMHRRLSALKQKVRELEARQ